MKFKTKLEYINMSENINLGIYNAAVEGDLEKVKDLYVQGGDINMAIMGASDGKHKEISHWALNNGACFIFGFQHQASTVEYVKTNKAYGKNISMLRGPGEVVRGTFKK